MANKSLSSKPAVKTAKTEPKPKKQTDKPLSARYKQLLHEELEARHMEIGITAASDLRQIWYALDALTGILRQDDSQAAIADIMRFPVDRLGAIVRDSLPHLDNSIKKLRDIIAEEQKEKQKGGTA